MTHRSRVSALLLPFALLAFIPKHPLEVVMSPAEQELRTLLTTYETSLNAGDAARIEQLYAEDGGPGRVRRGVCEHPYRDPLHRRRADGEGRSRLRAYPLG